VAKSKQAPALFEVIKREGEQSSGQVPLPKWWKSGKQDAPAYPAVPEKVGSNAKPEKNDAPAAPAKPAQPVEKSSPPAPEVSQKNGTKPAANASNGIRPQLVRGSGGDVGNTNGRGGNGPGGGRPARQSWSPTTSSADAPTMKKPIFKIRDGRVEISLNTVNSAISVGVILLALFSFYMIGYQLGLRSEAEVSPAADRFGADSIAGAQQMGINPDALGTGESEADSAEGALAGGSGLRGLGDRPASTRQEEPTDNSSTPNPAAQGIDRERGMNYIIIETFKPEHRKDAEHAQEWLESQQVYATLEKLSGGGYALVTVRGYDYPSEKAEAERMVNSIQALGKAYKQEYAGERVIRYSFRGPLVRLWSK
jgi:hypothetical protein